MINITHTNIATDKVEELICQVNSKISELEEKHKALRFRDTLEWAFCIPGILVPLILHLTLRKHPIIPSFTLDLILDTFISIISIFVFMTVFGVTIPNAICGGFQTAKKHKSLLDYRKELSRISKFVKASNLINSPDMVRGTDYLVVSNQGKYSILLKKDKDYESILEDCSDITEEDSINFGMYDDIAAEAEEFLSGGIV